MNTRLHLTYNVLDDAGDFCNCRNLIGIRLLEKPFVSMLLNVWNPLSP